MPGPTATVDELWVYPIKSCRGVSVRRARVTEAGFEHEGCPDRAFCVLDEEGTCFAKNEALSQRKVPMLATVSVECVGGALVVRAPGMDALTIPTQLDGYDEEPWVDVDASGRSTTHETGWYFGQVRSRRHAAASEWFTKYLNRDAGDPERPGLRLSGKSKASTYALARSGSEPLSMEAYPPIFPILEKARSDPKYAARLAGNRRRFADFAPFLLVSRASARAVAEATAVPDYPIGSFRGNVVVGGAQPWAEEGWARLEIRPAAGSEHAGGAPLVLNKIKECPRCTVPCRDGATGGFVVPSHKLRLWSSLKKLFPRKHADPEWGEWAGVYFGVYYGHGGKAGATVSVGDSVVVLERTRWDAHLPLHWPELRARFAQAVAMPALLVLVLAAALTVAVRALHWPSREGGAMHVFR